MTGAGFPHSDIHGSKLSRQLPMAFRSRTRPSSVVDAKAFTVAEVISYLEEGFVLRCIQYLSRISVATQLCHWRDNWCTRGLPNSVLSY